MKVLFLTSRLPWPPDRGDRLTVYHLMRAVSAAHEVVLVSFTDGREAAGALAAVRKVCARVETVLLPPARSWLQAWTGLALPVPSQVSYYRSAALRSLTRRVAREERPDAVFAHAIRMAPYGADLAHPGGVLWLADSLGLALERAREFAPWWKRPGLSWERWRVDRFTARMSRSFRETWAISEADLEDLRRIGCAGLEWVTHGVDERLYEVTHRPGNAPTVVFLGNLSVPHNVDAAVFAAREIWPRVREGFPLARLRLVGASPVQAVRDLGSLAGVEVTGPLPDLREMWAGADVLLAPLRFSTGIQNKVIEAMAAGVPVVTTTQAAAGVDARDGEHLIVAEGAVALAEAVIRVLRDPAAAAARTPGAREHVRRRFSWETAVRRFEALAAGPGRTGARASGAAPAAGGEGIRHA